MAIQPVNGVGPALEPGHRGCTLTRMENQSSAESLPSSPSPASAA